MVEEVVVNKEAEQRTETVRDSVRRTDVDVERINDPDTQTRRTSTERTERSDR